MKCCAHCQESGELFDDEIAKRELRNYRKDGVNKKSARLLIDGLKTLDLQDSSLLDIGGGVGTIPFELLRAGATSATLVEASRPYLHVAQNEARRRGLEHRLETRFGDFVDMADELPDHDVVTLDRVICCYPHLQELIAASTARANRFYGVVYPKTQWLASVAQLFADVYCSIRGMDFRVYIHQEVDETIQNHGFTPFYDVTTWIWRITLYERDQ